MPTHTTAALNSLLGALDENDRSGRFVALLSRWWKGHAQLSGNAAAWSPPAGRNTDRRPLGSAVFASVGALRVLARLDDGPLVGDLAVPIGVIRDCVFAARPGSSADLAMLLDRLFRPGLITHADNAALVRTGVASGMPPGWCDGDPLLARYTAAGIVAQDLATELETRAARVRAGGVFVPPALARSGLLGSVSRRAFRA